MNIKKGTIVTLSDNNKYLVLSKVSYENKNYLYLTSIEDEAKVKICCENIDEGNIKLSVITDEDLIKKLVLLFDSDIQSIL